MRTDESIGCRLFVWVTSASAGSACYSRFMSEPKRYRTSGPFRADMVRSHDPYELSYGHPVYTLPTGGTGASATTAGARALATDPDVEEAGIDAGYSPEPGMLRAPDIAIGNVPNRPGWIKGVPPLAVEYADVGQDEEKLREKIADLLDAGTQLVWVVRLTGPRRVEVYERGKEMRCVGPGETLMAPRILRNPVPVDALWDVRAADKVALRNLLQRAGYDSLEAVREEGREEGREMGERVAVREICEVLGIELDETRLHALERMSRDDLQSLRAAIKRERAWPSGV